jgi:hypothetical protein
VKGKTPDMEHWLQAYQECQKELDKLGTVGDLLNEHDFSPEDFGLIIGSHLSSSIMHREICLRVLGMSDYLPPIAMKYVNAGP